MEDAIRAKPEDVREHDERQLKDLQEAYGKAMLEIRARNHNWTRLRDDPKSNHCKSTRPLSLL